MKKYKLVKTYPNSPEIGAIVGINDKSGISYTAKVGDCYVHNIDKYPEYWEKVREIPLFTTEDGVDIYEGNNYWFLDTHYWVLIESKASLKYKLKSTEKAFSTEEASEKYILENKPCLSLKDVSKFYTSTLNGKNGNSRGIIELAKSKLNLNNNRYEN